MKIISGDESDLAFPTPKILTEQKTHCSVSQITVIRQCSPLSM